MWPPKVNPARWNTSGWTSRFLSSATIPANVGDTSMLPLISYRAGTIEAMGVYKTNTTSNDTVYRLAIYNSDSDGKPSTVLTEFGTVNLTSSVAEIRAVAGSATLVTDKLYWLAIKRDSGTTATTTVLCHNTAVSPGLMFIPYGWDVTQFASGLAGGSSDITRALRYTNAQTGVGAGAYTDFSSFTPTLVTSQFPAPWFTFQFSEEEVDTTSAWQVI